MPEKVAFPFIRSSPFVVPPDSIASPEIWSGCSKFKTPPVPIKSLFTFNSLEVLFNVPETVKEPFTVPPQRVAFSTVNPCLNTIGRSNTVPCNVSLLKAMSPSNSPVFVRTIPPFAIFFLSDNKPDT